MYKECLTKIIRKENLTSQETYNLMNDIMKGQLSPSQIAAIITALRMKGETAQEITGMAKSMREFASTIMPKNDHLVDTCGTGGDLTSTFNISTTAAFVVAGAGVAIAKHGNRAASGKCGSADLLEGLGINIQLQPKEVQECIEAINIGFMFAPIFHGAMKHASIPRKEIGIRTVFNILGPLSNPANAHGQLLGVYEKDLTLTIAQVLKNLGVKKAFVVHGLEGLDEISITGDTQVSELNDEKIKTYIFSPLEYGFTLASLVAVKGGDVKENIRITQDILNNYEEGPQKDIVILNAAAAIYVSNLNVDFKSAIHLARESITSGAAMLKLKQLREYSQRFVHA